MESCPQFKIAPSVSKGTSRTIVFGSAGSGTPGCLLMSISYSARTAAAPNVVASSAPMPKLRLVLAGTIGLRERRNMRPIGLGNRSGITAWERPPATRPCHPAWYSHPFFISSCSSSFPATTGTRRLQASPMPSRPKATHSPLLSSFVPLFRPLDDNDQHEPYLCSVCMPTQSHHWSRRIDPERR
jgi:hypothetical protein